MNNKIIHLVFSMSLILLSFLSCGERVEVVPLQRGNLWVWTPGSDTTVNQKFFTATAAPLYAGSEYSISSYFNRLIIYRDCRTNCLSFQAAGRPRCTAEIPIKVEKDQIVPPEQLNQTNRVINFEILAVSEINSCGLKLKTGAARLTYEKNADNNFKLDRLKLWQPHFDENGAGATEMIFAYPPEQY